MSSSGRGRRGSKKSDPLNKRIPDNPRYAHVKHVVDTGASINNYLRHLDEIKQNYRYRKDEIFRRLKVTTFAQLILQVQQYDGSEGEENVPPDPAPAQTPPAEDDSPPNTARSTLSSVISGMGEMDVKGFGVFPQVNPAPQPPPPDPPYLLLDVRDKEDYDQSHIITAKHYPPAMLSRSCSNFTKDILDYKNKPGKIIILYDENERVAPRVATVFVQKEIDNVFMLSGGMKVLHKVFPDCMITGPVPSSCLPSPPPSARGVTPKKPSSSRGQQAAIAAAHKIPHVGSGELKEAFTDEDLDKIEVHLDTALMSGSRASSRSGSSSSMAPSRASSSNSTRTSSSSNPTTHWKY